MKPYFEVSQKDTTKMFLSFPQVVEIIST